MPRRRWLSDLAMIRTKHSSLSSVMARPMALKGNRPELIWSRGQEDGRILCRARGLAQIVVTFASRRPVQTPEAARRFPSAQSKYSRPCFDFSLHERLSVKGVRSVPVALDPADAPRREHVGIVGFRQGEDRAAIAGRGGAFKHKPR